jgi:hypothetical protein
MGSPPKLCGFVHRCEPELQNGTGLSVQEPQLSGTWFSALNRGATKAAVCRTFGTKRTTLIETLARAGWSGSGTTVRKELLQLKESFA